jgi:4-hydroxy-3-methylbut-2-enyl diphosphate reductase
LLFFALSFTSWGFYLKIKEMEITVAEPSGFCYGVKRALEAAIKAVKSNKDKTIKSLGPLIHNPEEVKRLQQIGIIPINNLDQVKSSETLVIRTHGVPKDQLELAKSRRVHILDMTCPHVKTLQQGVKKLSYKDYFVILIGDPLHPEIIGALSYVLDPQKITVIKEIEQIYDISATKVGIIPQTTLDLKLFERAVITSLFKFSEIWVLNTICTAAMKRQQSATQLAKKHQCILIVGGRKSANTQRLFMISKKIQPNTYLVETKDEISPRWFDHISSVGIIGATSTSIQTIQEVVEKTRLVAKDTKSKD